MLRRAATRLLPLLAALLLAAGPAGCNRPGTDSAPASAPSETTAAKPAGTKTAKDTAKDAAKDTGKADAKAAAKADPAAAADKGVADVPVILMLGDSLTAGFGLPSEASYPALIQERLRKNGFPYRVVNAGVSGDTSAGGLARLDWLLRQRVDVMLLALGANDGLRGLDPHAMRENLAQIIERAQAKGIEVILAGMEMPENYGPDYRQRFKAVFPSLAERYNLPFIPFLLKGVALKPELNQADGIHPNARGAKRVAETVWRTLEPVLARLADEAKDGAQEKAANGG